MQHDQGGARQAGVHEGVDAAVPERRPPLEVAPAVHGMHCLVPTRVCVRERMCVRACVCVCP